MLQPPQLMPEQVVQVRQGEGGMLQPQLRVLSSSQQLRIASLEASGNHFF